MWQFFAAVRGFAEANAPKDGARLSEAEKDELWAMIEASNSNAQQLVSKVYISTESGLVLDRLVRFSA